MKDNIINCKDANVNFTNTVLTLIFTIPVLFCFLSAIVESEEMLLISIIFVIIDCIVMYYFALRRMIRYIVVRKKGVVVSAIVKGYCDDIYSINEQTAQKILLSLKTDNGIKEICYRLSNSKKDYEINSEIKLYMYNDIYLIKDKKQNKRQKLIIVITFIIFLILTILLAICTYIPKIFNISYYQLKMNNIEKNNKEIRVKFNELEYEIPEEYHLSLYQEDWNYQFETRNDKHFCMISILSMDSKRSDTPVGKCQYYNINKIYEKYDEIELYESTWCYMKKRRKDIIEEKYMINDGKNYYSIDLHNYKDDDEKCSTSFNEFIKTIKLKK